jgi:hypothetical protein
MSALYRFQGVFLLGLSVIIVGFSAGILLAGRQDRVPDSPPSEAISIVVSAHGFSQASYSLRAGSYLFVMLNRTGFDNITVYLERLSGNNTTDGVTGSPTQLLFQDSVGASGTRLARAVTLNPGTYRLRVANRPAWVCPIRVN